MHLQSSRHHPWSRPNHRRRKRFHGHRRIHQQHHRRDHPHCHRRDRQHHHPRNRHHRPNRRKQCLKTPSSRCHSRSLPRRLSRQLHHDQQQHRWREARRQINGRYMSCPQSGSSRGPRHRHQHGKLGWYHLHRPCRTTSSRGCPAQEEGGEQSQSVQEARHQRPRRQTTCR